MSSGLKKRRHPPFFKPWISVIIALAAGVMLATFLCTRIVLDWPVNEATSSSLVSAILAASVASLAVYIFVPVDHFTGRVINMVFDDGSVTLSFECFEDVGYGFMPFQVAEFRKECLKEAPIKPQRRVRLRWDMSAGPSVFDRIFGGTRRWVILFDPPKAALPEVGDIVQYRNGMNSRSLEIIRRRQR
jgi:hypothetical protein